MPNDTKIVGIVVCILEDNYMIVNVFLPLQIHDMDLICLFQYSASIEENCLSSELIRLQAIDLDEEGTDNWLAQYSILSGNDGNWFEIQTDPKTNEGILKLVKVSMGSIRVPSKEDASDSEVKNMPSKSTSEPECLSYL